MTKALINAIAVTCMGIFAASPAYAAQAWSASLTNWSVRLENDRIYVMATANMPGNCSSARAEISTSATLSTSTSYSSELYSFILASYSGQMPLKLLIEGSETNCKVYGAKNE